MSTPTFTCLEVLETRLAPAGLVTLTTTNGVLTVTGDAGENRVEIVETAPGVWTAQDLSGSGTEFSLNGQPQAAAVSFFIPTGGVKVDLKEGNDNLNLSGLKIAGPVTVTDKAGDDSVGLYETHIGGAVKIDLGTGNDVAVISRVSLGGALTVKLGSGEDGVALGSGHYRAVTVDLGTGTNTFNLDAGEPLRIQGNLSVVSAGGVSEMTSMVLGTDDAIIHGHLSVKVQAGGTLLNIGYFTGNHLRVMGNFSVQTGAGNDEVILAHDLTVGGQLSLKMGEGENRVSSPDLKSFALGSLSYAGGQGRDVLELFGTSLTIAGNVTTSLGAGPDNVVDIQPTLAFIVGGNFTYQGANGRDLLFIDAVRAEILGTLKYVGQGGPNSLTVVPEHGLLGAVNATGGSGQDDFTIGSFSGSSVQITVLGKISASLGSGLSNVGLNSVTHHGTFTSQSGGRTLFYIDGCLMNGSVTVKAGGSENSYFDLSNSTFAGVVNVSTGSGNDTVVLDSLNGTANVNLFRSKATFSLGAGDDLFRAGDTPAALYRGNVFGGLLTVKGGTGMDTAELLTGYGNAFDVPALINSDVENRT